MDSLKHEYNRQLLMELILKKLGKDSKTYFSKHHLHSAIKLLIQDTISRFKTMRSQYGNTNFLKNYDYLYELVNGKEMGQGSLVEREIQHIKKSSKLDYIRYESLMRTRFIECHQDIVSRKNYIDNLRRVNSEREDYLVQRKAEIKQIIDKSKLEDEDSMGPGKRKTLLSIRDSNNLPTSLESHHKMLRMEEIVKKYDKEMQEEEIRASEEIENNNTEIKRIENEVTDLKMKKVIYRYRLKECYISILKKPKTTM